MKLTFQELAAFVVAIVCILATVVLTVWGYGVPDELKGLIGMSLAYVLGSRTSQPI